MPNVVVIGGGASGLMAAVLLHIMVLMLHYLRRIAVPVEKFW